ncbi:HAD-IIB family hydrolase [Magnetovibrio sp.]|uniref:HAD-IIB family hydrolase n=1 Tax=Magnetovibrio sp. TaxID=2024836 RepID=UPI002F93E864
MKSLDQFSIVDRQRVRCVLTDIDDTLTTDGRLTAEAYGALEALQKQGLLVIAVTGRPAGWCDHIARMWPVDAVVGENGAFYFRYDAKQHKLVKRFLLSGEERAANRRRLELLQTQILSEVPGAALASDQLYREADLAIDFCEDVAPLPWSEVERIVGLFTAAGATAKISSIHVNGWFGTYDKLTMTRIMMDECFGLDLDRDKASFVFVGDSPNDAPMFAFFPHAVGVANLVQFEDRLEAHPTYVTDAPCGAGFAALANALIAAHIIGT